MRPERLELEGFTAFRAPTTVDFTGAELFALTGATGAGKSSLIDAITFALYGTVPRYSDVRRVEPVISQGAVEARVRLDFSAGGMGYSAVRVARRGSSGGASTREARLESADGEILASDADGVSEQVERLLGLSYQHFTTCVVLPQGEFARFLHEKPGKRQDLLVQLLDLGIYERMAQAARQRASASDAKLTLISEQLTGLEQTTEPGVRALERRGRDIEAVMAQIDAKRPELDALDEQIGATRVVREQHEQLAGALAAIQTPAEVVKLGAEVRSAQDTYAAAQAADRESRQSVERLETGGDFAERRVQLERTKQLHADETTARETLASLEAATARIGDLAQATQSAAEQAAKHVADAERLRDQARLAERALELAAELAAGDDCPVCGQTVTNLRDHPHSGALAEATVAVETARRNLEGAQQAAGEARRANEQHLTRRTDAVRALGERSAQLVGQPDLEEVTRALAAAEVAQQEIAAARATARAAATELTKAEAAAKLVLEREARLRGDLDRARGSVAVLDPPTAGHDNLADDWTALSEWACLQVAVQKASATDAGGRERELGARRDEIGRQLGAACAALGIDPGLGSPREAAAVELARVTERASVARQALKRRRSLIVDQRSEQERHRVSEALGGHLSANRFEKWVLDEAMERLVARASEILHGLSAAGYSLKVDARRAGFEVIDHANADATRSVRTLSGGETFLASLALALALADQIADLAPDNAPRLESIFLDEGFGSLDLDTLDTVAAALEELGAQGRTVGVVSHIRELADRLPTRFEVRKEGQSATVTRVDR